MKNLLKAKGQIIGEFENNSKICNYRLLEVKNDGLRNNYITDILNNNLGDIVHISVFKGREELFDSMGILEYKNDLGGSLWRIFVGDKCLDDILWTYSSEENEIDELKIIVDLVEESEVAK